MTNVYCWRILYENIDYYPSIFYSHIWTVDSNLKLSKIVLPKLSRILIYYNSLLKIHVHRIYLLFSGFIFLFLFFVDLFLWLKASIRLQNVFIWIIFFRECNCPTSFIFMKLAKSSLNSHRKNCKTANNFIAGSCCTGHIFGATCILDLKFTCL